MKDISLSKLSTEEKVGIVCMYYAKLASDDDRYKACYPTLKRISESYNIKYRTVTNWKDAFDAQFDNGRKGWWKTPLEKRKKGFYKLFLDYKDIPIEEHYKLVVLILEEIQKDTYKFFSIKTKDERIVNSVLKKRQNVEFDGLNILKDSIQPNQLVFIVFGGDRPAWDPGLAGMGIVSKGPHDEGYDPKNPKNFKITVDIKLLLDKPIKREDLVPYGDTYGIIGIGPITKWEPNQAISQVPEKNSVALMRAMLELSPSVSADLESILEPELIERVKGATVIMVPTEVDYGESLHKCLEVTKYAPETFRLNDKYIMDIDQVLDGFTLGKRPMEAFQDFINSNKNIILTGAPGTGKTTLAELACQQAVDNNYISGYITTTAISDWSTFDTIGGYMPDSDGKLKFNEGVFLKSIRENKWIIVDEINRAEVDKAFGQFFTALAGKNVDLQYRADVSDQDLPNISIKQSETLHSYYDDESASYYMGRNWRIIGTMNTYDKNSLFNLSYAFMRRFALVPIPTPTMAEFENIIRNQLNDNTKYGDKLTSIVKTSPRKFGAAIILDIIDYLRSSNFRNFSDGLCAVLIPQFEGLSFPQIKKMYKDFGSILDVDDKNVLRCYLSEFFDIDPSELDKVKFDEPADESDE